MASMTDFVSWEVAIVGDVLVKDLVGIKEEEEAEATIEEGVECIAEEVAGQALLYPLLLAPRTTCLAILRSTCAIESVSGSGVVLAGVPRKTCTGTWMWGVNCCNKRARNTPKIRPVSSDRAARDMDDALGRSDCKA
jgi:hypothetical protein